MSPDRHKHTPISIRPPADLREWLYDYAEREGLPVRAVIIKALTELRRSDDRQ